MAGVRCVGEAGPPRLLLASDAPRPGVRDSGEYSLLPYSYIGLLLVLTIGLLSPLLQEVGWHKPSRPRVPEDAVDRAARRVAAEEEKKKKDAEKAQARERRRARDTLEKRRRQQEREGLPREPSPETPDDGGDDDDEEEDDMAARLGLSPGLGVARSRRASPRAGRRRQSPESGRRGPGLRHGGNPRGHLTPRLEELR
jgi:hypothetical protein